MENKRRGRKIIKAKKQMPRRFKLVGEDCMWSIEVDPKKLVMSISTGYMNIPDIELTKGDLKNLGRKFSRLK